MSVISRYLDNGIYKSFRPSITFQYFSTNNQNEAKLSSEMKSKSLSERVIGFDSNFASATFTNRWLMVLPSFATHMCIGSPWAWSILVDVITKENGFVAPAASDWTLMEAAFPMSMIILFQGITASLVGKWQAKVGPRKAMAAASIAFGGGLLIGSLGICIHSLALLYFGYGCLGGIGIGLAYTPPVQALMQWFPDRKGIASGLTIAGFGSGALLFTPAVQYIMKQFVKLPIYVGPLENFVTTALEGKLYANINGELTEVVLAGKAEISSIAYSGLSEGLYIVGSGSTGATEALAIMGVGYLLIMLTSALIIKVPHKNYVPLGMKTTSDISSTPVVVDVSVEEAMKLRQFYLLGLTLFCLSTGGMGMFSVAKPMMNEVFSSILPAIVTSAFASNFLLMLSFGNLSGRLIWASISDRIGRTNTFHIFALASIPLYVCLPSIVEMVVSTGSSIPLYGFIGSTVLAITIMGGVFAILPAYEADLFGTKSVGPIHGRMLLFSSAASLAGPSLLINLRSYSEKIAVSDLLTKISPEKFQQVFGAPIEKANELLAAKTLSIGKLMVLTPPGTIDPTPHLYDTTMYAMGGLMAIAVITHSLVKPIQHIRNKD